MDFREKVTERLQSAREDEARLLRELEAVRYLISSDEKALSIYTGSGQENVNGNSATAPAPKAATPKAPKSHQRITKVGAIVAALKKFGQEGATVFEAFQEAHKRNSQVDRDYAGKALSRMKIEGKLSYNNGKYSLISEKSNDGEN